MRILKRNLAFMLALVMALGLMTTASAANVKDYKDANNVTYVEAVDVLTALKVLEGTDGSFNPTDTLTREQGAKIIAYLMLGADAAKALSTSVAPFKDVAANRWSAGYIAYCVSQNIIGGYGDGNFGPEDTLTANQFAKMLLCAVGYNVNGEFTGSNWEIEVSKTALTEGVFDGNLGANFSAGVKREEAALYAFNTLTSVMTVSYSDVFGTYYSGKLFNNEQKFNNEYTLGYKLYNLESKDSTDDFGRECHYWVKKSTKLTGNYHDAADATYTAAAKSGTIYTDLGLTKTVNATVIRNGVAQKNTFQLKKGLTSLATDSKVSDGGLALGNGIIVEAYADDDENVTLVVIDTYLAQVTDVDTGKVTVEVLYGDYTLTDDTFETAAEYKEDDYVIVTIAAGEIQSMAAATTETGKISVYASSYVTLDGTKYNKTLALKNASVDEDYYVANDYDSEMAVILDQYGYAIGIVVKEEADADYSYVLVTNSEGKKDSLLSSKAAVVEVMYLDGKTEVLSLETRKDGTDTQYKLNGSWVTIGADSALKTWTGADNSGTYTVGINGFYRYTINDAGQIVLKALKSADTIGDINASVKFTKGSQTGSFKVGGSTEKASGLFMNSKTVYHIVEDKDTVKTYTGYKNIGVDETGAKALMVLDGNVITDLYILDTDVEQGDIYGFYNGTTYNTTKGTWVTLFVDGAAVNYLYDADDLGTIPAKGVWTIEVSDNELTSVTPVATAELVDRAKVTGTNESYFQFGTGDAVVKNYYSEDVKVYDITDGGAEATIARGDYVVYVSDGTFVTHAYIVAAPDSTTPDTPTTPTTNYTATAARQGMTNAVKFTVTGLKATDTEAVTVKVFNYNNGVNAELGTIALTDDDATAATTLTDTVTVANAASDIVLANGTYQLTFAVYAGTTLVDTFGPLSFVVAD
ncbi:MAG: S-layer homology domain-containing protein [Clostridiaceae bacterium]|nr:S-layer homology domain-containing protein [Clostridiaceae bacterium]